MKDPEFAKQVREKGTKLELSFSQTSDYNTKLQYSKEHGTGTKTDT